MISIAKYLTIAQNTHQEMIIKKSRFITRLYRIHTVAEAQEKIQQVKKIEYKATHNCSCYRVGNQLQQAHDDGEPQGTAGLPMLAALQQMQVQDVAAIVTRYFGGIKLGASGLIRAYRNSVVQTIQQVGLIQRIPLRQITLILNYHQYELIKLEINRQATKIQTTYTDQVQVKLWLPPTQVENLQQTLQNKLSQKIELQIGDLTYQEVPYSTTEKPV